ncbi:hypothetical protein ACDA63_15840 [Uliginosibacterium sp. sgz301328]|uniref:hypothetical protein n=1 Tax=Uliginosibacterium sp. sgz301328 TaxID=3243764 RepID=UPI00359D4EF1
MNIAARTRVAVLAGIAALLAACAQQPAPTLSGTTTIVGMLVLKGAEPHATVALRTDKGEYILTGIDQTTAARLQRQILRVTGVAQPVRPPQAPAFEVYAVEPVSSETTR